MQCYFLVRASKAAPDPISSHGCNPPVTFTSAEALLAAIVDTSDDAIISKNLAGVVTSWNRGAERIFGYSAAEMVGQPILRLLPPERTGEEQRILAKLQNGEKVDHYETVRVRKDGRKIDVSLTISPLRSDTGEVVGASKIARDITCVLPCHSCHRDLSGP